MGRRRNKTCNTRVELVNPYELLVQRGVDTPLTELHPSALLPLLTPKTDDPTLVLAPAVMRGGGGSSTTGCSTSPTEQRDRATRCSVGVLSMGTSNWSGTQHAASCAAGDRRT